MRHEWTVTCPKCQRVTLRAAVTRDERRPVCAHAYHDADTCEVCLECRIGVIIGARRTVETFPAS